MLFVIYICCRVTYILIYVINFIDSFFFTDECDMRSNYVKCETCKQAVHENTFENHRKDKKCTSM